MRILLFPGRKKGLNLYRNKGNHHFEDVAKAAGLPTGSAFPDLAVAAVNGDGWPDVFVTSADGKNRLYLNDGKGKFREAPGNKDVFEWKGLSKDDPPAGVCIADVNRLSSRRNRNERRIPLSRRLPRVGWTVGTRSAGHLAGRAVAREQTARPLP